MSPDIRSFLVNRAPALSIRIIFFPPSWPRAKRYMPGSWGALGSLGSVTAGGGAGVGLGAGGSALGVGATAPGLLRR